MRHLVFTLLAAATATSLLGACSDGATNTAAGEARVVVAVVDTAFNPYHAFFHAGGPLYGDSTPAAVTPAVLDALGVAPQRRKRLTRTGDMTADLAADATFWSGLQRGEPVWFEGTNLIAVSYCHDAALPPLMPHPDKSPHGVGTSASVLRANPEAVLLLVESCTVPKAPEMEYAGTHPAVDLLSYSFTVALGLPITSPTGYDSVVELGKLLFQAAGNVPNPTPIQNGPGNWWAIGVSGIEEASQGQTVLAATLADFVANYSDSLPFCMDCESELIPVGGTSLSTPRAAGVASRVLLEARRALNHRGGIEPAHDAALAAMVASDDGRRITNWDLRRALEHAAWVGHSLEGYTPTPGSPALPINPLAPWLQLGWGELTPAPEKSVVAEALAQLGLAAAPSLDKPDGYCQFQATNLRLRQAYWDAIALARNNGETVPSANPVRFCDE